MDDNSLLAFKAINAFVSDLNRQYTLHSVALYNKLLSKTSLKHTNAIRQHCEAFRTFCENNREAIRARDSGALNPSTVRYSERVRLDLKSILERADNGVDVKNAIWSHILTIAALLDPQGGAKAALASPAPSGGGKETELVKDIMQSVQSSDLSEAKDVKDVLKSDTFANIVQRMTDAMNDGSLNIANLMGAVQGMVSQMPQGEGGGDPNDVMASVMGMMGNMGNQLQVPDEGATESGTSQEKNGSEES